MRGGLEASIKLLTRWVTVSDDVLQVCSLQKVLTQLSSYLYIALVCIIKHSGVPLHAFRSQTADNLIRVSFVHVMEEYNFYLCVVTILNKMYHTISVYNVTICCSKHVCSSHYRHASYRATVVCYHL